MRFISSKSILSIFYVKYRCISDGYSKGLIDLDAIFFKQIGSISVGSNVDPNFNSVTLQELP